MAKRRGNGEGTITKRRDGRYEARYMVQTANGPKRKVLYGKTRSEVAQKRMKAMADRDGDLVFDHDLPALSKRSLACSLKDAPAIWLLAEFWVHRYSTFCFLSALL